MRFDVIPGWLLLAALSAASIQVSELVSVGGRHPLEASALVVVAGIALRNTLTIPQRFMPGILASETLLIWGIVMMGVSLDYNSLLAEGSHLLAVIVITMTVGFAAILALGRALRLSTNMSLLMAVGTTICGGTAIAVTAPLIKAHGEETSYAVATIALWGVIAILVYPLIGGALGAGDYAFGVFAGTAIQSTPQVIGAAYIYSVAAGTTATAVKLVRNCFMAPLALAIGVWQARRSQAADGGAKVDFARAFPWFLFGYFVMAWFGNNGFFTPKGIDALNEAGRFLIVVGMAGVGCNTSFAAFRSLGSRPLLLGLLGAVVVAVTSVAAIAVFIG